jgi:hypothetical protein
MGLISKKTFRKWAQPLTDRKLTLENAERFAEVGNTITVRARRTQSGLFTVNQVEGKVTWEVGCAWLDGGIVNIHGTYIDDTEDEPVEAVGIITPGQKIVVSFNPLDHRDQVIYCLLHYIHHGVANKTVVFGPPEEVTNFYTATRAECVDGQVTFESDLSTGGGLEVNAPVYIDTSTNVGTTGVRGIPVCLLSWVEAEPPTIPYGYWTATTYDSSDPSTFQIAGYDAQDPSKLIIFNILDYSDYQWPTISELRLVGVANY